MTVAVGELNGMQKAAAVLLQIGPQRASKVLRSMSEAEVLSLMTAVANLPTLDSDDVARIVAEFVEGASASRGIAQGGLDAARAFLETRLGAKEAADLLANLESYSSPGGPIVDPLAFLVQVPQHQMLSFLRDEHPQTVAVVLAHLPPEAAARLLAELPADLRSDAAQRVALLQRVAPEVLDLTATVLRRKLADLANDAVPISEGGVTSLVEILNRADRQTEKGILADLDQRSPELAEQIRNQLFVFDDVVALDDKTLQKVLRHVVVGELAVALKAVSDDIREKFLRNLSERAATDLVEEIELLGPTRLSQVEAAQAAIVRVVRELDAQGEILLMRGDDDMVV
ncbi:MAG: flagellar motor switch protein FliG [Acidimicrobiales bacterium]